MRTERTGSEEEERREEGENEEPCLRFVQQCKPAFSYHCIVSIVPVGSKRGELLVITEVENSERKFRKERDRILPASQRRSSSRDPRLSLCLN